MVKTILRQSIATTFHIIITVSHFKNHRKVVLPSEVNSALFTGNDQKLPLSKNEG